MPRYPLPDLNSLPAVIQEKILEVQEKSGFIPHVFLALARRPAEDLRAISDGLAALRRALT